MQTQAKQLEQLYLDYIYQCRKIRAGEPFGARLLSSGRDSRSHPCHQAFYDDTEALLCRFLDQTLEDGAYLVRWMLEAPYLYAGEEAHWYLLAVQKHSMLLIPRLDAPSKKQLCQWYNTLVPRHQRLPVQDEIAKMLET
jgi:hypothetical protein